MSDPTGGEPNPFADIIDLFREVEAAAPSAQPAPPAVEPPRGGIPITPKGPTPAPSRRHRAVLLLPVALLALAGGGAAAVIHQRTGSDTTTGPSATAALPRNAPSNATSNAPSATPGTTPSTSPDPRTAAYSTALDALAAAHGTDGLTAATEPLGSTVKRLRRANGRLAHAEAAHLDSLVRLSRSTV